MGTGETSVSVMTTVQQKFGVEDVCKEADQLLSAGGPGRAVALYAAAFKRHAGATVSHVQKLGRPSLAAVISTLETWLDGDPRVDVLKERPSKALAAAFLSALSPKNLSASLFEIESVQLGSSGGCEEVIERSSALLEGNEANFLEDSKRLAIELIRALAFLLLKPHRHKGLHLYMKSFRENRQETIKLVKCRQAQHLFKIVSAFLEQMTQYNHILCKEKNHADGPRDAERLNLTADLQCLDFLQAISPEDVRVQELRAVVLFCACRFEESAQAYTTALGGCDPQEANSVEAKRTALQHMVMERTARLLIGRGAAYFSQGGRAAEASRDLGSAFEIHPAAAREQFQKLFSDHGTSEAARIEVRREAERGLSQYKEAVLARPDLRSSQGVEQLDPVIAQLRALCHMESNGGGRELRVRLADCLLLRGEFREALSVCSQLASASSPHQSYQNTVQVLRGYARLFSGDHQGALEDFQAVIEHSTPHPSSCVRALCGRGLLRMLKDAHYLTALDYMTASRLQPLEAALAVRCFVPWNCRGLLCTVLLEQGRAMLEQVDKQKPSATPDVHQDREQDDQPKSIQEKEGTPEGIYALAVLLMELEPSAESARILAADALYCQQRVEEAYRLLLSIGFMPARSTVLARLILLQLHRGFLYNANQLLKKLIQCGDTSCLQTLLAVASPEDRVLLQRQCHAAARRIMDTQWEDRHVRQAVAYLSIAIISSGGEATDSLLMRARCYALLGQHKTAIFDFSAILRDNSENVQALCGRGFTHLILNQRKELLRDAFLIGGALMKVDAREPRWHLLYFDILIAKGDVKAADAHLKKIFKCEPLEADAQARLGVVEAWRRNFQAAAKGLTAHEGGYFSLLGQWEQALALMTVAVRAGGEGRPLYWRQRAACLARLGQHRRAAADLDQVVPEDKDPEVLAEDLCHRGRSLILSSREDAGLEDFVRALDTHPSRARRCVEVGLGVATLADRFLRAALRQAWRLTETGLKLDGSHGELRRLRSRIKRESASSCIVH
ncbi:Tetratricopeptide repeat protein 34-like [Scleropages formosus]|uniref:Tetratricopeptide repeat protein 34-like n=1 Tax=Scleropages formosus TaxID=113540 RepID=A0A0P7UBG6_SCLFO|nr:Tetratricopeptide repeat protein 34-like [Scleropages formosus]